MHPKEFVRLKIERLLIRAELDEESVVVTLMGSRPRELGIYDRLGIDRRNIWVPERDASKLLALDRKKLRLSTFSGTLADFAQFARGRPGLQQFDFLNADFSGSFWNFQQELSELLVPLWRGRGKCLAVTSLARRDDGLLRAGRRAKSQLSTVAGLNVVRHFEARTRRQYELFRPRGSDTASYVYRELGFLWWLVLAMERAEFSEGRQLEVATCERYLYDTSPGSTMQVWLLRMKPGSRSSLPTKVRRLLNLVRGKRITYTGKVVTGLRGNNQQRRRN